MKRSKKVSWVDLKKLILCIIVTLLFGRSFSYCQGQEEFDSSYFQTDQRVAKSQLPEDLALEVLNKHEGTFPATLGQAEPNSHRSVPVPPVGVTLLVFASAAFVGWLRRRTPMTNDK